MGANSASRANPAERAEERVRAYELKLLGKSLRAIGKEMGCSHEKVRQLITEEADTRVLPLADEYRKQTIDRLEMAIERLMAEIVDGVRVARNAEVLSKLEERLAKMLGYDAPVQQEITATVETRPEVLGLVERARAEMKQKEAELRGESS